MIGNKSRWAWFSAVLLLGALALVGCGKRQPIGPDRQGRMVYVDTASGEALAMDIAGEFPAIHPRTGKRTLMPALYCPKCGKWHPVPPPDQINRTARAAQCPKTGEPLTPDGPWPGEDANVRPSP
ncbi:MAG: hypothetical protein ACOX1P_13130 [Thermoguttaceae bacterium]|jgi:hypothetical protein